MLDMLSNYSSQVIKIVSPYVLELDLAGMTKIHHIQSVSLLDPEGHDPIFNHSLDQLPHVKNSSEEKYQISSIADSRW
jgi:hypothetical protein